MASSYPGGLDSFTNPTAGNPQNSPSHSAQHANANDAIEAIQAELGLTPSGGFDDVADRIQSMSISALDYGAVGDGITDDTTAIQAALDDLKRDHGEASPWLDFSQKRSDGNEPVYMISSPLKVWANCRLTGPAVIKASTSFDFAATPQHKPTVSHGMLEGWQHPDVDDRYIIGRYWLKDLEVHCNNRPSSTGLIFNLQQPSYFLRVRVRAATSIGFRIKGQEAQLYSIMLTNPGSTGPGQGNVGLLVEDCEFMSFFGLNVERYDTHVRMNTTGSHAPTWIYSAHHEVHVDEGFDPYVVYDVDKGVIDVQNAWITAGNPTSTSHIVRAGNSGNGAQDYAYKFRNVFVSGNSANTTINALKDVGRNVTLPYWNSGSGGTNRVGRHLNIQAKPHSDSSDDAQFYDVLLDHNGGYAAYGRHNGADRLRIKSNSGQSGASIAFEDSGGTERFKVEAGGHPVLPTYTNAGRPAANTVPAGTVIFNSDDNYTNASDGTNWRDPTGAVT